jgi:gliding motility-associated-like protein
MKKTLIILLFFLSFSSYAGNNKTDKTKEAKAREWINNQPLEFIENKGQFTNTDGKPADNVLFKTSFGGCDIYITDKGLSYVFVKMETDGSKEKEEQNPKFGEREEENKKVSYYRLDMNLEDAHISKSNIIKENESKQGHSNYFYAHCPEGIYDVKGYGKITIKNIYKGIDWIIYTNSDSKEHPLKYDFVVHPEADYKDIRIKFLNAQSTSLSDNDTKLKIETIAGNIEEGNLFSYQANNNNEISSKYVINKDSIICFEIANYDTTKTLVIDPLVWATYYGGSFHDGFRSICADNQGNIIITGYTYSTVFPNYNLTGAYWQPVFAGGSTDIILLKFNSQSIRQWVTFYGGINKEYGNSTCVDNQDNIYITGETQSQNFPTQQLTGAYWQAINGGSNDAFILKFNNLGVRKWATYYGGNDVDCVTSICLDSHDNLFVTGYTTSANFPTQQLSGAYWQTTNGGGEDVFILKFNNMGIRQWATFYGGNGGDKGFSIYQDSQDNIYITGNTSSANFPAQQLIGAYWQATHGGYVDAFILKFNNIGVRQWATYYGGNSVDHGTSLCIDTQDNIYITGETQSQNFPTQQLTGAYWQAINGGTTDIFILKFDNMGVRQWATYYGGNSQDQNTSICLDGQDNLYVTGITLSTNFPIQQLIGEYWQPNIAGISADAFILKFSNSGVRQWSSFYGTNSFDFGTGLCADYQNNIYFIGEWQNSGAYTVNIGNGGYYNNSWNGADDSYILKITNPCNNHKTNSIQTNRNNICINYTGNITLTALGGYGDTLKWYSGSCGMNYIGKNSPLTIQSPSQTTTYYARWESACDTSVCESITINVDSVLYTTSNQIICQGDFILVGSNIYSTTGIYSDTLITYLSCDSVVTTNLTVNPTKLTFLNPSICQGENFKVGINTYFETGIYTNSLTCNAGCDSIIITNLKVNPSPIVNLGIDTSICIGTSLFLNASYPNINYLWQDGSTTPTYNVTQQGLYWVKVTLDSCSSMDSIYIYTIVCPAILELPNIISPNNDGSNDIFLPLQSKNIEKMNTQLFNRWGNLVFETDNLQIEWNGKSKGQLVADGVYFWIVNYTDTNGKEGMMKGSVTVMK